MASPGTGDKNFYMIKAIELSIILEDFREGKRKIDFRKLKEPNMAGTPEGGKVAAATNKAKYGPDFYKNIGAKGGRNGHTGGFFANRELARIAGEKGGRISRRGKSKKAIDE